MSIESSSPLVRQSTLETFTSWHRETAFWREVYARALAAFFAAPFIAAGAAAVGLIPWGTVAKITFFVVLPVLAVLIIKSVIFRWIYKLMGSIMEPLVEDLKEAARAAWRKRSRGADSGS
jgi:hypothetical protein